MTTKNQSKKQNKRTFLIIFSILNLIGQTLNLIFLTSSHPELSVVLSAISLFFSFVAAGAVAALAALAALAVAAGAVAAGAVAALAAFAVAAGAVAVAAGALLNLNDDKPKKIKRCKECGREL